MNRRIIGIVGIGLLLSGCTNDSDPLADGVLTIGTEADFAPYSWTTNKANATEYAHSISGSDALVDGYDVMMAENIADQLGVELEVKKITWDGLIPAAQSGSVDCVFGGISPTPERTEQLDFTDAYHEDDLNITVVVNKDGDFANATSLEELAGANITAQQGTYFVGLLDQIDIDENSMAPATDTNQMIDATLTNTIDGYLQERTTAEAQIANNPNLMMLDVADDFELDPSITTTSIGVAKDSSLTPKLNEALANIDDQTRQEYMDYALTASTDNE